MTATARATYTTRVRPMAAVLAGSIGTLVFFTIYYATLGLLPRTSVALSDYHPISAWNERLDLAQFVGCLVDPPYATVLTWWIGAGVLTGFLISCGAIYGIICSWGLQKSTPKLGIAFGAALFFVLASAVSLGSGYNPAVMRDALPDVGFFYLGWTGWATLQLLISLTAYGYTLATTYRKFTSSN